MSKAKTRVTWLSVPEMYRLNTAARTVREAVDGIGLMLVGSSLERQDYRDVDLRYILHDHDFAARFPNPAWLRLANAALSDWLAKATGLDIDFQFQSMTEANEYPGRRHPVGHDHHFDPGFDWPTTSEESH